MNRPILWVSVFLLAGTYCAAFGILSGLVVPVSIFAAGVLLTFFRGFNRNVSSAGLFLCILAAGALLWNGRHQGPTGDDLSRMLSHYPDAARMTLEGRVTQADLLVPHVDYMSFRIRVDRAGTADALSPIRAGVVARWTDPDVAPHVGDLVRVSGRLSTRLGTVNPGVHSAEAYYHRHGIYSVIRLRGAGAVTRLSSGPAWSPRTWASRLRTAQAERLSRLVPASSLPFVLTVWLGDRRTVGSDSYAAFLESGTAHILAVSGIHTGIIYVTVAVALKLAMGRRRRRLQILITMAAVLAFALTAGARVTSMRAAIMVALYLTAELFDREPDAPTALSIAAILFTLSNPDLLFDAAFQLSFLSVASLLLFGNGIQDTIQRFTGRAGMFLSATLAVQILPLPIAISLFHVFPLIAPLANLLVIPLLSIVLWLCMITSAFSFILPPAAPLFGHAIDPFVYLIDTISRLASGFSGGHLYLTKPTGLALTAYWLSIGLAAFAFRSRKHRRSLVIAATAAALSVVLFWNPLRNEAEVTFLDVRSGDAIFVRTPSGATLLVDGGELTPFNDAGRRIVAPFLWSNHVSGLDAVVATHSDRDHAGGLYYILDKFRVGALYLGPELTADPGEAKLLALCEKRGIPVRRLGRGDEIELPGARVEVLHPPNDWTGSMSDNNRSVVLRVTIDGIRVLLTGDVESEAELEIVKSDCVAEILKVPHHGSRTSSTRRFVNSVDAEYAVISTGRNRGRPIQNPTVLDRYTDAGAEVYTTDTSGGIRFTFENGMVKADPSRQCR